MKVDGFCIYCGEEAVRLFNTRHDSPRQGRLEVDA